MSSMTHLSTASMRVDKALCIRDTSAPKQAWWELHPRPPLHIAVLYLLSYEALRSRQELHLRPRTYSSLLVDGGPRSVY